MQINLYMSLTIAVIVLLVGHGIIKKVEFFRKNSIPDAVVGGLLVSIVVAILYIFDAPVYFDVSLQTPLMLAFFASIGLSAKFSHLLKGGPLLLRFVVVVVGLLFLQNILGVSLAKLFGLDTKVGLLAGSITLTGGHGTGATWAQMFLEQGLPIPANEIAVACATFGLVAGGLIGGPVARYIIAKYNIKTPDKIDDHAEQKGVPDQGVIEHPVEKQSTTASTFINTLALFMLAITIGTFIGGLDFNKSLKLPTFVYVLFSGVILINLLHVTKVKVSEQTIGLLGNVSLSLFLAFALMSLKLFELVSLVLPLIIILILQTLLMALYAIFVTFRAMGKDYDAAILAAGHCGFGLGATPTAIANMHTLTYSLGASHLAFLIVPITGAFIVDIANLLVIQGFLWLGF